MSRECESRIFTLVQVGGGRRTRVDLCAIQKHFRDLLKFCTFAISMRPLGHHFLGHFDPALGRFVYSHRRHRRALRDLEPASGVLEVWLYGSSDVRTV